MNHKSCNRIVNLKLKLGSKLKLILYKLESSKPSSLNLKGLKIHEVRKLEGLRI